MSENKKKNGQEVRYGIMANTKGWFAGKQECRLCGRTEYVIWKKDSIDEENAECFNCGNMSATIVEIYPNQKEQQDE